MNNDEKIDVRAMLRLVINAMIKDGDDPVKQLSGYILSEDPTYITELDDARKIIRRLDRDDILAMLIEDHLEINS